MRLLAPKRGGSLGQRVKEVVGGQALIGGKNLFVRTSFG